MNLNYRLVSFGTVNKRTYRKGLNRIQKRCILLNIPYYMWYVDPVTFQNPGWYGAVLYKPTFIKEMLHGFDGTIVYLDADCEILDRFDLPEGDWDIGVLPHQILRNRLYFTPWVVSFLVFKPTPQAKHLLDIWEHLCQWENLRESDHERFMWALATVKDKIQVQNLLPDVREKVHLDPRHRKRCRYTIKEVPTEYDNWSPEMELPEDKCEAIIKYVKEME